jgi:hypothetical protein
MTGGIYPTICLINHDCVPNAQNNWNADAKHETIHATRDIRVGEEITIAYVENDIFNSRREKLKSAFGFECSCNLCTSSPSLLHLSDTRRLEIERLDEAIGSPNRVMFNPGACLADCQSLLQLVRDEYQGACEPLNARLYYDAFQICITHGDQARAKIFAERVYKARLVCEGEDSPATQDIKKLMQNPAGHRNFGASKKWKTRKGMVPKGLGDEGLEKWLWRKEA